MKGCPFNNFGPCRKEECIFFLEQRGCIIHLQFINSAGINLNLLELISVLSKSGLLNPSEFESADEYNRHVLSLKEMTDAVADRIQAFQKLLKDVS